MVRPDELRALWRWHNGTRPGRDPYAGSRGPFRRLRGGQTMLFGQRRGHRAACDAHRAEGQAQPQPFEKDVEGVVEGLNAEGVRRDGAMGRVGPRSHMNGQRHDILRISTRPHQLPASAGANRWREGVVDADVPAAPDHECSLLLALPTHFAGRTVAAVKVMRRLRHRRGGGCCRRAPDRQRGGGDQRRCSPVSSHAPTCHTRPLSLPGSFGRSACTPQVRVAAPVVSSTVSDGARADLRIPYVSRPRRAPPYGRSRSGPSDWKQRQSGW